MMGLDHLRRKLHRRAGTEGEVAPSLPVRKRRFVLVRGGNSNGRRRTRGNPAGATWDAVLVVLLRSEGTVRGGLLRRALRRGRRGRVRRTLRSLYQRVLEERGWGR